MRIYNLTDIETPVLRKAGLVNMTIAVGPALLPPGGELEVGDTEMLRRDILCFTGTGAIALKVRPASYMVAKAALDNRARLSALEAASSAKKKGKK